MSVRARATPTAPAEPTGRLAAVLAAGRRVAANTSAPDGSNVPLRPTPGAAAAMDQALGMPEHEVVQHKH